LIEKRANGKVAEVWRKWLKVRDGKPWEGAHPSRTICGRFARRLVINAPAARKTFVPQLSYSGT